MKKQVGSAIVNDARSPSRRALLAQCLGFTTAAFVGAGPVRADQAHPLRGELFAFRAPRRDDLVFALTIVPRPLQQAGADRLTVRLHAGANSWTVGPFATNKQGEYFGGDAHFFVGRAARVNNESRSDILVVVAVPQRCLAERDLDVWGEAIDRAGARSRIGNPLLSGILGADEELARLHATLDPSSDHEILASALVRKLANSHAPKSRIDPRANRLTEFLLPDTLRFDHRRPAGFTFAAQNGRRPDDTVDPVVKRLLTGLPLRNEAAMKYRASDQFPYFVTDLA
jgi:hypothetical protein